MEKNKNFIITLTGDPGSGKSTTYAQLKKCFESEGYDYVLDGHHRVISSILAEKTLIPYETS